MGSISKSFAVVLVFVFLIAPIIMIAKPVSGGSTIGNSWVERAPMPTARGGLGVVAVDGAVYAIGGSTSEYPSSTGSGGFVGTNEEYNITTGVWTYKAPMPVARSYFAIAAYQGKIYCIGGQTGWEQEPSADYLWGPASSSINEVYDTATNSWQTLAPMPIGDMYLGAEAVDGLILVKGIGFGWAYNITIDSWSNTTALSLYSWYQNGNPTTFLQININNKTLKTDVQNGAAAVTSGMNALIRTYVIGSNVNEVYDPYTDTWSKGATLPTPREYFGLAVVNDSIYAIGGFTTGANEQYFPFGYGTPDLTPIATQSPNPTPTSATSSPTPSVPEFPSWTALLLLTFMVATGLLVYHKKHTRKAV